LTKKTVLLLIAVLLLPTATLVKADSLPGSQIVTILPDGTVDPQTAPVIRVGNSYVLTAELNNTGIDIKCSNVTFDGAGFTVHGGIGLQGDYITVYNMTISSGGLGVLSNGSYNRIFNNVFYYNLADVCLLGNYTNVSGNLDTGGAYRVFYVDGDYNNVTGNELKGIEVNGHHNWVAHNAVEYVAKNGVDNTFEGNDVDEHLITVAPEPTTPTTMNSTNATQILKPTAEMFILEVTAITSILIVALISLAVILRRRKRQFPDKENKET
jgi:hypothetical protein